MLEIGRSNNPFLGDRFERGDHYYRGYFFPTFEEGEEGRKRKVGIESWVTRGR